MGKKLQTSKKTSFISEATFSKHTYQIANNKILNSKTLSFPLNAYISIWWSSCSRNEKKSLNNQLHGNFNYLKNNWINALIICKNISLIWSSKWSNKFNLCMSRGTPWSMIQWLSKPKNLYSQTIEITWKAARKSISGRFDYWLHFLHGYCHKLYALDSDPVLIEIATLVMGHSLVRSLVCLLHTAHFARALRCAHSFACSVCFSKCPGSPCTAFLFSGSPAL